MTLRLSLCAILLALLGACGADEILPDGCTTDSDCVGPNSICIVASGECAPTDDDDDDDDDDAVPGARQAADMAAENLFELCRYQPADARCQAGNADLKMQPSGISAGTPKPSSPE